MYNINDEIYGLLKEEPFFATVSRYINKIRTEIIPAAGVSYNTDTGDFNLYYNPYFFEKLTAAEKRDVLKHEFYHLVFGHVFCHEAVKEKNKIKRRVWNYAMDCAINSFLSNIPWAKLEIDRFFENGDGNLYAGAGQNSVTLKLVGDYFVQLKDTVQCITDLGKETVFNDKTLSTKGHDILDNGEIVKICGYFVPGIVGSELEGLPPNKIAAYYYKYFLKHAEDDLRKFCEEHNFIEGDGDILDYAEEKLKEISRKAVEESARKGWGTVPESVREEIKKSIQSKIDWRKVLRFFIKQSQRSSKTSSKKKINKRFPYIYSGKKINRTAKVGIFIDQSGSVCDQLLSTFFAELENLAKICEFTVFFFDTEIDEENSFIWKKGRSVSPVRTRCGGTDFDCVSTYVDTYKAFDGIIILTDLEAPVPRRVNVKRLWVAHEGHDEFNTKDRIISVPVGNG